VVDAAKLGRKRRQCGHLEERQTDGVEARRRLREFDA
jgi:hypothetical protein